MAGGGAGELSLEELRRLLALKVMTTPLVQHTASMARRY
jgi:hypothetical protein